MSRWEERVWGGGDAQGRAVYKGGQMSEGAAQGRSLEKAGCRWARPAP